jgi:hypothetical protein
MSEQEITPVELPIIEQSWSEVDDIYKCIAESICEIAVSVQHAVGLINNGQCADDNGELVVTTRGLARDLEQFTDELLQIRTRHEDRDGLISTEDDLALSISVFSDYITLSDRFKGVIFPPMLTITEHMTAASEAMQRSLDDDTEATEVVA